MRNVLLFRCIGQENWELFSRAVFEDDQKTKIGAYFRNGTRFVSLLPSEFPLVTEDDLGDVMDTYNLHDDFDYERGRARVYLKVFCSSTI
jgi:hypothetical protein